MPSGAFSKLPRSRSGICYFAFCRQKCGEAALFGMQTHCRPRRRRKLRGETRPVPLHHVAMAGNIQDLFRRAAAAPAQRAPWASHHIRCRWAHDHLAPHVAEFPVPARFTETVGHEEWNANLASVSESLGGACTRAWQSPMIVGCHTRDKFM